MELVSLSLCRPTVPLSADNGLSRLTKLTTSKGQARPIQFGQSLSNQTGELIRISKFRRSLAKMLVVSR